MPRSSISLALLILVIVIAVGAVGWMHTKTKNLRHDLHKAEAARSQLEQDLKEAKGEAAQGRQRSSRAGKGRS